MSFLTQGRWSRPALALGFDPLAVVQRAIVTGLVQPAAAPARPARRSVSGVKRARKRHPELAHLSGNALRVAWNRKRRAVWRAAGLTSEGKPPRNQKHPDLRGLRGRAYVQAWRAKRKAKP